MKWCLHGSLISPFGALFLVQSIDPDYSHNTYLADTDQIAGCCRVEAYTIALLKGCRCVELDCHDGKDGEPEVFHGMNKKTLNNRLKFKDVIEEIKKSAFPTSTNDITSVYPLCLSLEDHCSKNQQDIMAKILEDILGDQLLKNEITEHGKNIKINPSPAQLKNKIFLKGKTRTGESRKSSQKLSDLIIYTQSHKFQGFDKEMPNFKYVSSMTESTSMKYSKKDAKKYVGHTQNQLVRIYPEGSRINSRNYNPILPWASGCQLVALNYQRDSHAMLMNQAWI